MDKPHVSAIARSTSLNSVGVSFFILFRFELVESGSHLICFNPFDFEPSPLFSISSDGNFIFHRHVDLVYNVMNSTTKFASPPSTARRAASQTDEFKLYCVDAPGDYEGYLLIQ